MADGCSRRRLVGGFPPVNACLLAVLTAGLAATSCWLLLLLLAGCSRRVPVVPPAAVSQSLALDERPLGLEAKLQLQAPNSILHRQQQPRRRLPDCLIIGARKCGTRALLDFLAAHPSVAAARGEVHYFDRPPRRRLGLNWYRERMPLSRPGQLVLEKTPAYLVTPEAPRLARRQLGSRLRLLVVLRDPVTRVVSDYAQHLHRRAKAGRPGKPLEQLIMSSDADDSESPDASSSTTSDSDDSLTGPDDADDATTDDVAAATSMGRVNPRSRIVRTSVYHWHLRRWLRHFPASQLHIVDGDKLIAQPHVELARVEQFLGLAPFLHQPDRFVFNATKGFYCLRQPTNGRTRCLGSEKGRRHPAVSPSILAELRAYFAGHDRQLAELTGRRFAWMPGAGV